LGRETLPHFVIRYDMRDTGRSTSYPMDGLFHYTRIDLINDALRIIEALGIQYFHVVGFGFGGSLASELAGGPVGLRVKSLTLLWSSPTGFCTIPEDRLPLPDMDAFRTANVRIDAYPNPEDWMDKEAVVTYMGYMIQLKCGRWIYAQEKSQMWMLLNRAFDRAAQVGNTLQSSLNHIKYGNVRWPREVLSFVRCPTLIMHSEKNGLGFPVEHAHALKEDIRGSTLVVFDQEQHSLDSQCREIARSILYIIGKGEETFSLSQQMDPRWHQQIDPGTHTHIPVSESADFSSGSQQATASIPNTPALTPDGGTAASNTASNPSTPW
jgi:pimeloyl-ACP methyl ester carboxylesterase